MKKLLAILLALLAVLALMTGCAKEEEEMVIEEPDWDAILGTDSSKEEVPEEPVDNTLTALWLNDDALRRDYNLFALSEEIAANTAGADALVHWLTSREGLAVIDGFGRETYGDRILYISHDISVYNDTVPAGTTEITLVTTETIGQIGFWDEVLPAFEETYGYTVNVQIAEDVLATALEIGADLVLVHDVDTEEFAETSARVVDGQETAVIPFLYNNYLLCGPASDPAGVMDAEDVKQAFEAIAKSRHPFISAGDGSPLHQRELTMWDESLGITAEEASYENIAWYTSAKADAATCLAMAQEENAYVLADKLSYLNMQ